MARRPKNPPVESEALTALDDLARVFWDAALAELEAELDREDGAAARDDNRAPSDD
jgi:hypothetical protein